MVASVVLLVGCSQSRARETESSTRAVAERTLQALKQGGYSALASQMHYPADEIGAARQKDEAGVRELLVLLAESFGRVTSATPAQEPSAWYEIGVLGGTVEYWSHHPKARRYLWNATFEKHPEGWVFVDVIIRDGKPELKGVWFALPKTPANHEEINRVFKRLAGSVRNAPTGAPPN